MPFDADSGQVFKETLVRAPRRRHLGPTPVQHRTRGQKPSYTAPDVGVHSLRAIVIRRLLCNLEAFSIEALKALPSVLFESLWRDIKDADLDSLAIWQIFACSGFFDDTHVKRFKFTEWDHGSAQHDLRSLVTLCNDSQNRWLTHLTIGTHQAPESALAAVSRVFNLRSVHFSMKPTDAGCIDRVLREWARAARDRGSFGKLEMIFINNTIHITPWLLQHLNSFPALSAVIISCSRHREAIEAASPLYGWIPCRQSPFLSAAQQQLSRPSYDDINHRKMQPWSRLVEEYVYNRNSNQTTGSRRPFLDVDFGEPLNHSRSTERPFDGAWVFGLQRNWAFETPRDDNAGVRRQAAKKRKVKESKSQSLHALLDGF